MSLEDEFSDVIAKAMMGLGMDARELSRGSGVDPGEISGLLRGEMDETVVRKICPLLGIDADALVALPGYMPEASPIPGVSRIELPFRQWTVNAWLLEKGNTRVLFDTGFGKRDVVGKVSLEGLNAVLITHAHDDHVGGVAALLGEGIEVVSEVEAMKRKEMLFADFSIRAVDLSGHKRPAVGYFTEGFGGLLFVAGDAVFAGSMGRCRSNADYLLAFDTLQEALEGVSEDCVILPGHGPATTLAQEMESNPFHAGFINAK